MAKYDLRDQTWDDRSHEATVLIGFDAFRLSMGAPTQFFPTDQVQAWLDASAELQAKGAI